MIASRNSADVLVIGGGPAGSMAAIRLASAGCAVTLLEKESAPHHKVCGEFLSREAIEYLHHAGVDPVELGGVPITRMCLSSERRAVEAKLPFRAMSLSRYMLDEVLLARAQEEGCDVRRGFCAASLKANGDGWAVETNAGELIRARAVFLATGKHELRGWTRERGKQMDLVGFKLHFRLGTAQTNALREVMELFLFSGGYGGLSLVERGVANLCLVVRRSALRVLGGWSELLAAIRRDNGRLDRFLRGAQELWERPLAISPIPYGYLAQRREDIWCVGDQAAVIPSFTGDGMSIALHSGALAAQIFLETKSIAEFNRALRMQLRGGMWIATLLSRAMVTEFGRKIAPLGLLAIPGAIGKIALSTRIPERALAGFGSPQRSERLWPT